MYNKVLLKYVPHGSSTKYFYPITSDSPDCEDYSKFKEEFKTKHDVDFIVLYNSRNIRRKSPSDIILSFRRFCDGLSKEKAKKCCLLMKTAIVDENGTDLMFVKRTICPDYKVVFVQDAVPTQQMNWMYNISDLVFFMSSAEGFGLAANEGIMVGKMLVAPVTGGLQDQMRFEDENGDWIKLSEDFPTNHRGKYKKCGVWAVPLFPSARVLNGSIPTPAIFDDFVDSEDAAIGLRFVYDLGEDERIRRGNIGREWILSSESGMSSPEMAKNFISGMNELFDTWVPPSTKWEMIEVGDRPKLDQIGLTWWEN